MISNLSRLACNSELHHSRRLERVATTDSPKQADAYSAYDAFFKDPLRGLIEVGCWAHARRYFYKALESDRRSMAPALLFIAQIYRVEENARTLPPEDRRLLRALQTQPIPDKLLAYLQQTQLVVLPKSPAARAISYTLRNWIALTRYLEDGDLQIDNNATERAIRGIAIGRNNWTFLGSAQLRRFLPAQSSESLHLV